MEKLRFALVGCGRILKKHAEALKGNISNAILVAVCDINLDKAKQAGMKYQVNYYTSYDEMLTKEQVDIVCILTESGNHAKHSIDIVQKYKTHIVVEKPMALTLEDADKMIETCDLYNKKLFVVKQNRYNLPVIKLREALEKGRFGKINMGTVRVRWCRTQEYYNQDKWRGTWSLDGGVFTNQASHHIDLLEWMLGEPISVFAKSKTYLVDIETEDTGVAVISFKNGAIGIVEATTATRPKDLEGSLSILGEKGTVVIGGFAVNEMQTWNFIDNSIEDNEILSKFKETPPNVYGFGHVKYLQDVCDSVINNTKALVDGLEGRKSLELINAIYESIETNQEVNLRFQPKKCKLGH
ncbi:MAG: Gfo/Idh/MocA family oxidoreductase [Candidatus Cloacimonetes bacterium]|jgi:predicted dehydrogenase|nr:Gfo/Idh/MocA family oxidoreductase [Candidatus Cloacimonadota bacterium]MDD4157309.1 Gfo/Idh/MocA family oxidoreductase [Candidatus Cloacimonadota bacterium]